MNIAGAVGAQKSWKQTIENCFDGFSFELQDEEIRTKIDFTPKEKFWRFLWNNVKLELGEECLTKKFMSLGTVRINFV